MTFKQYSSVVADPLTFYLGYSVLKMECFGNFFIKSSAFTVPLNFEYFEDFGLISS